MSAYNCDHNHLLYLTLAAYQGARTNLTPCFRFVHDGGIREVRTEADAAEIYEMLRAENAASVAYRYHEAPEPAGAPIDPAAFRKPHHFEPVQVFKACHCYAYQASEHPGWITSAAKSLIDALINAYTSLLPGYEEAEWGAPELDSLLLAGRPLMGLRRA